MQLDFTQVKNGPRLLGDVDQLRTDLDTRPIGYAQTVAVAVAKPLTTVVLRRTPTADPVTVVVNSLAYAEGESFTVDRSTRILTWTDADLTITRDVAESVAVCFKTADREDAPLIDGHLSFVERQGRSFTLKTESASKNWDGTLEYSTDRETWTMWTGTEVSSSNDGKLYLRGRGNTRITGKSETTCAFVLTQSLQIDARGNAETLLDYATVLNGDHPAMAEYCFSGLFAQNTSLVTPPALPATTMVKSCYQSMFKGCIALTNAPALATTTLASYCYTSMFYGCPYLISAPAFPATTQASSCYTSMFKGCTSLASAPALPATTLVYYCYSGMFKGCTSLVATPSLQATTLADGCYYSMFNGCTALTSAPALPATELAVDCYKEMFKGCTSLTSTPALPATELVEGCYSDMFYDCTSLVTPPMLPATTLADYCYGGMFYDCTALETVPELPATTLFYASYQNMFRGCTTLTTPPTNLSATTLAIGCYGGMFNGCTNMSGVIHCPASVADNYYRLDVYGDVPSTVTVVYDLGSDDGGASEPSGGDVPTQQSEHIAQEGSSTFYDWEKGSRP